jgi:hypothetical protein
MNDQNFTTTFTVDQTPEEAFAVINNVRGGGQEKLKVTPTNSVMSLLIVTKTSITANRR